MTTKEALAKYHKVEIDLLLTFILRKSREFLYMNPDYKLTTKQLNNLTKLIKRRQKGEPMAYILGYKDFYGLRFKVNRNVLIPRPETEWLVDRVLSILQRFDLSPNPSLASLSRERSGPRLGRGKTGRPETEWLVNCVILNVAKRSEESQKRSFVKAQDDKRKIKILDMGTGSGCIIIAVASLLQKSKFQISNFKLWASDISAEALKVAKENAKMHHPHPTLPPPPWLAIGETGRGGGKGRGGIKFIQSDLFNQIKGRFDIIVANLPYVPMGDYRLRIKDLRYEPKKALTDNTNEWKIYQKFFEQLSCHIHKGSMVLLEIDPKAKRYLSLWAKKYLPRSQTKSVVWGFPQGKAKFYRDLNNLWRYMEISF